MPDSSGPLQLLMPWSSSVAGSADSSSTTTSASLAKRDMDDGAIAGTVVGIVIGCALLAFCLYPVIVHYFKRWQRARQRKHHDAESGLPDADIDADGDGPHRLSSSDSIKESAITRGIDDFDPNVDSQVLNFARYDPKAPPSAYTPFDGEYMPQDIEDDQPGVLKGTSEDYYRPSIPSEAFGMVPMPDVPEDASPPIRPLSRTSTLSANVKHMFRRKSTRDRTLSSHTSSDDQSSSSAAYQVHGGTQTRGFMSNDGAMAESPTQLSPSTSHQGLSTFASNQGTAKSAIPRDALSVSPPQSPPGDNWRKYSPSPQPPAPGTVNPMEIMAPSTESEMWHRTEHQLFVSSHESSPNNRPIHEPPSDMDTAVSPASIDAHATPMIGVSPQPASSDTAMDHNEATDTIAVNQNSSSHLAPSSIPEDRRASNFSDRLTPLPGAATDASSSQPTPSTQTDTPSPESVNSSDFRHSASPAPHISNASPKQNGVFPCDEPGCSQVFDQPHKLKHHQRYHSKDHKCPYANCGKGFGTKTHLQRHINDRHEKKKKFHCCVTGCDYSRYGGKAFPRKDNWKRHMVKIHGMNQRQLPEPIEVDVEMGGV